VCDLCDGVAASWIAGAGSKEDCVESSSDGKNDLDSTDVESITTTFTEPSSVTSDECLLEARWRGEENEKAVEKKAMEEAIFIEEYLRKAIISEVRVDAGRLARAGCFSKNDVLNECTTRTQHTLVEFRSGRLLRTMGADLPEFGAMYDHKEDKVWPVSVRGNIVFSGAPNGWYYTCNHMKVWNSEEVVAAISHALDYGVVADYRSMISVVLGVPGSGKTYTMMKLLAEDYQRTKVVFLVLSVTGKAAEEARGYGEEFGIPKKVLQARVKTLDSYLINGKFPATLVCVDEYPMTHAGKIDAALSLAAAQVVRYYGDGRQIFYDTFTAELDPRYSGIAGTLQPDSVTFLGVSHRLGRQACAAWLDLYPVIYPCDCHDHTEGYENSMHVERIGGLSVLKKRDGVRYHTYTQGEADEVMEALRFSADRASMKLLRNQGLATVHTDQGSTHEHVETIRSRADYDRNSSARNPSLYNRIDYVLTDMTRHKKTYCYKTVSAERDMICKRVEVSNSRTRLKMVDEQQSMGLTTIDDMLCGKYHSDILSGKSL